MVTTLRSRAGAAGADRRPLPAGNGLLARRGRTLLGLAACAILGAVVAGVAERLIAPGSADGGVFVAVLASCLAVALAAFLTHEIVAHEREVARFRDFTDVTPDWFWEMDHALRFTYVSPGGLRRFGRQAEEMLGRGPQDLQSQGVATEEWQVHLADLRARRPFRDFRLQRTDSTGQLHHLSISGTPVFDLWGRFRGYRGTSRDITAEVERAQRSAGLEQRLFQAIENFPEAIILWDAEGRLVHANSHYRRLVGPLADHARPGVRFEDLLRRAVELGVFVVPEGEAEEFIARRLAEHRSPKAPAEYALGDGRWGLITERLTGDGGVLTIYTEITTQKRAQLAAQAAAAELGEKQRQLDAALDNIAQGITLYDAEQRLVLANRRYREIFGLPAGLIGPGITLREIMELSVRVGNHRAESAERAIEERLALARRRERMVLQQRLADGRIIELVHQPLADGGSVVTFTDVTEREHASRALLAAKESAESANRAKSQFLAKMSHELRTPLNAVLGFSEIIRDRAFGPDAIDRYSAYANDIHFSGEHLLRVINDILDMSKIEAGQTKLTDEHVDVPEQIGQALGMLATSARTAQVTITPDLAPALPRLRADRRSVLQVLLNLLSNAIKFSRPGSGVSVAAHIADDGWLQIAVTDGGIGIAAADQARIFEPFYQAGSARHGAREGTGLGLSICKSIMELHGGSIRLDSDLGRGTRATIRFPPERLAPA